MNPELKAKWVAALRSGKYNQGTGCLYSNFKNVYCCLGVLSAIKGVPKSEIVVRGHDDFGVDGLGRTSQRALWTRNDGTGDFQGNPLSFAQIADYIEENL